LIKVCIALQRNVGILRKHRTMSTFGGLGSLVLHVREVVLASKFIKALVSVADSMPVGRFKRYARVFILTVIFHYVLIEKVIRRLIFVVINRNQLL